MRGAGWVLGTFPIVALAILAASCGEDTEADTDLDAADTTDQGEADGVSESYVVIGTGFPSYVSVTDGDTLPIIEGIQGGFHLWGGFEVSGLQPQDLTIEFVLEWNGERIGGASYTDDLWGDADPYEYGGVAIIFNDNDLPTQVSGEAVTVSVRLEDTTGVVVSDSAEVIPECCSF